MSHQYTRSHENDCLDEQDQVHSPLTASSNSLTLGGSESLEVGPSLSMSVSSSTDDQYAATAESQKNKRSVQWSSTLSTVVATLDDIEDGEDKNGIWYEDEEYRRFKQECSATIELSKAYQVGLLLKDEVFDIDKDFCERGLETWINEQTMVLRQRRVQRSVDVVLDEQSSQREHGIESPIVIANLYRNICNGSQIEAHHMGKSDEREVLGARSSLNKKRRKSFLRLSLKGMQPMKRSGSFFNRLRKLNIASQAA